MNTSLREATAREIAGFFQKQVARMPVFLTGMEAERRLSAGEEREGERPQQSAGICAQGQNFVHKKVDFSPAK